ncbi:lysosomal acid glucosylceramidase-like isoform X2 [Sitophilus oryzae]|uniref:Glucosylceramidase n=1 Tax=Sitophilus oryzae TaxID=7048 RepID=A0A6J2YMV4_SITOR|nr:lysosomal acid glucosylceramidase-like isoform X2 [Sitophilus oryzae]
MFSKKFSIFIIGLYYIPQLIPSRKVSNTNGHDCVAKDFGQDSTVCVCNASYCDTIPLIEKLNSSMYVKITTNKDGLRFHKEIGIVEIENKASYSDIVINVNASVEYQAIHGYGGAFTDATGINLASLDGKVAEQIMKSYFGIEGIGFSLCRVPIAATDFSTRPYTYLENEDPELTSFSLQEEDYQYKIPYILQALNLTNNNLKLISSPWIAPLWMKTIASYAGSGTIKEEYHPTATWAKYLLKFLEEYEKQGIDYWGITTGNEPSLALYPDAIQSTPTVAWTSADMQKFIKDHLGPTIENSSYSTINLIALDDQRGYLPDLNEILNDSAVNNYIDGIGIHWYQDWYESANLLDEVHNRYPNKFLLGTEACSGSTVIDLIFNTRVLLGSWQRAEDQAKDIIEDMNHWVTGWISWNMVLNTDGGPSYTSNFVDAHIIANITANEFYKQPAFYTHGHFSKLVPPNSKRIQMILQANNNESDVVSTAFKKPDGGIVITVLNSSDKTLDINIIDEDLRIIETVTPNSLSTILYWKD